MAKNLKHNPPNLFTKITAFLIKRKILLFIFLALTLITFFIRGYHKPISFISGDEPHYIMMTESLVQDGDFNLKNDIELGRAIKYYPDPTLFPHLTPMADTSNNQWYSIHTIGLPLLLALPYRLGGVVGARIWVLVLQLSSVLFFYMLLKRYLKQDRRVMIGMVLLLSCSLFWQNIGGIFPDLIMVSILGASLLLFGKRDLWSNIAMLGLMVVGLLMQSKILVLIGPIFVGHNLYLLKEMGIIRLFKAQWLIYLGLVVSILLYVLFLYTNYGILSPSQLYGVNGQLFSANPFTNLLAILTDRTKGLLIYFPVLAVSGPYIFYGLKGLYINITKLIKAKKIAKNLYLPISLSLGLLGLLVTQLGFSAWSGSYAPNGRYMLVFVFLVIFLVAKYFSFKSMVENIVVGMATAVGAVISLKFIFRSNSYMNTATESFISKKFLVIKELPLFSEVIGNPPPGTLIKSLIIICLLIILSILLVFAYNYKKSK